MTRSVIALGLLFLGSVACGDDAAQSEESLKGIKDLGVMTGFQISAEEAKAWSLIADDFTAAASLEARRVGLKVPGGRTPVDGILVLTIDVRRGRGEAGAFVIVRAEFRQPVMSLTNRVVIERCTTWQTGIGSYVASTAVRATAEELAGKVQSRFFDSWSKAQE